MKKNVVSLRKIKFIPFKWSQYRYQSKKKFKSLFPGPMVVSGQSHNKVYLMSKFNWKVNETMLRTIADSSVYKIHRLGNSLLNGKGK